MENIVKKARYIRTSTAGQNNARQLTKKHPNEILYIDVISGSTDLFKRPEGSKLIEAVEKGKVNYITVESVDRLGRSTTSVINQLQYFLDKNVTIKVENLGLESIVDGKPNEIFTLICTVLANLSQMEKTTLRERQLAGIAAAKERGDKYQGRTLGSVETDAEVLEKHKRIVKVLSKFPNLSLREVAKLAMDESNKYKPSPNTVKKVKLLLEKEKAIN